MALVYRPRRCRLLAREIQISTRADILAAESYLRSFTRPLSMTNTMSSIVIDVSEPRRGQVRMRCARTLEWRVCCVSCVSCAHAPAILVAMTILRTPFGGREKMACCCSVDSVECSGSTK